MRNIRLFSALLFTATLALSAACFAASSSISSLVPSSGPVGTTVTLVGDFRPSQSGRIVSFNGIPATVTSWSTSQVVVIVPIGATTGNVVVTMGQRDSNAVPFTVTPSISTISPNSGSAGTLVTIDGTTFGSAVGSVTFNGMAATISVWNASEIVAVVPSAASSGSVIVTTSDGLNSNSVTFNVVPSISSLSPASGPAGASITITGFSFGAVQGNSTLVFGGISVIASVWTSTSITAVVPGGLAPGSTSVVVRVNDVPSNAVSFTVLPTPIINTLSPASAPVGASVVITGSNFGVAQPNNTITFNGTLAIPVSWSDTQIVCDVPAGASSGVVIVTANGVPSSSAGPSFTVLPPAISSLSPASGSVGTSVVLTGTNFGPTQGSSMLTFGGMGVKAKNWSDSSISSEIPNGLAAGSIDVVVSVNGVSSSSSSFVVTPRIGGVLPLSAPVGGTVTITGSTFGVTQGTSTVSFNGRVATSTRWSDTEIVVAVPDTAETGSIVVTVNSAASNSVSFTVLPTPSIGNLSPASGPLGAPITVIGSSFGAIQGNSTITFNGIAAIVTSWSDTQIVAAVPEGATSGIVIVTVNGVPSSANGPIFTVLPTPSITSLSLPSGPLGTSVTVTGTNFGLSQGTSTISFGGVVATVSNWSDTSIVAAVPSALAAGPVAVVVTVTGVGSNSSIFTVTPQLIGLSPALGVVGASVTITGSNFGATQESSSITFNGLTATAVSWSAMQIVVLAPADATSGNVIVTVNNAASNPLNFTVVEPPVITNITPTTGVVGAQVTITGSNFGVIRNSGLVSIGGVAAAVVSWSDTQIVAVVSAGATTGSIFISQNGITSNSVAFTVITPFVTGRLEMTRFSNPPDYSTINLSDPEVIDWVHWGRLGNPGVDRRSGVNLISNLTTIGQHSPVQYSSCFDDFSWSNGNPTNPSVLDACSGLFVWNIGDGFQLDVPADTTPKTLKLYVGADSSTGRLSASLSDNSAAAYVDTGMLTDGDAAGTYTIDFQAASPGQKLTITYTLAEGSDITIEAAALTPRHPYVAILQPVAEQSFTAPAAFTATVQASQSNTNISSVSLLQDNSLLPTLASSPFDFQISNLAAGNYVLTAQATDGNGLSQTSQPVPVHVVGDGGELVASVATPQAFVDLTAEGTADWALLGRLSGNSVDRKANVFPLIGAISRVQWAYWYGYLDNAITYSATDGTQAFSPASSGVYSPNPGSGFEFTVDAGLTERTVNVYVGTYRGQGEFEAYLSDGSAAPYFDSSTDSGSENLSNQAYSLRYHAASEGQKLTIRYTLLTNHFYGNVTLQAITVGGPRR